jgi:hypothetical protein
MGKLYSLYIDFLALPGKFGSKKFNGEWHLKHVCPNCPEERKRSRYVDGVDQCWWKYNWERRNFDIPKSFGSWNYVRYWIGLETKLDNFSKYLDEHPEPLN